MTKSRRREFTSKQLSMLVEDVLNIAGRIEKVASSTSDSSVTVYCGAAVTKNLAGLRLFTKRLENHKRDTAKRQARENLAAVREGKLRTRIDRMRGELERMTAQLDRLPSL